MIITMIITIANRRIETNRRVINHIFVVAVVVGVRIYILYTHIFVYNNFLVMFFPSSTTLLNLKKIL